MVTKLSAIVTSVWSYAPSRPDLSRERVISAAKTALKELPWVAGAVASGYLQAVGIISPLMVLPLGALGSMTFFIYLISAGFSEEKTKNLLTALKVGCAAFAIFELGLGLKLACNAALLMNSALAMPASWALLLKVATIYQSLFIGKFIIQSGLSMKARCEAIASDYGPHLGRIVEAFSKARLDKVWAELDEMKCLDQYVGYQSLLSENIVYDLLNYLVDNPDKIDTAVRLFPAIFNFSDLRSRALGHPDFNQLLKVLAQPHLLREFETARDKVAVYLEGKFKSPITLEEIETVKAWLRTSPTYSSENMQLLLRYQEQIKQAGVRCSQLTQITFENEGPYKQMVEALKTTRDVTLPLISQLDNLRAQFVRSRFDQVEDKRPLDQIFDELGFTVGNYEALAKTIPYALYPSYRMRVVKELNDRGVYCQSDLEREKIVGTRNQVFDNLAAFLERKLLTDAVAQPAPTHFRVVRIATAFFNTAVTAGSLGLQLAAAPIFTSLGFAYGFATQQKLPNLLRHYRFHQASLFHPGSTVQRTYDLSSRLFNVLLSLNTSTLGKGLAFFAGANQGETVRDYISQIRWIKTSPFPHGKETVNTEAT